ncbi:hypothetical protein [Brevundimonas naejangsanensis]|uniref:hypothetical protein n=1 Tax=Brevundimonas naejangsanensis TaxID=588932 RepID=UPI0026F2CE6F|nr:hypothetical protein [Brevundimonas naejangsanensis]
MSKAHVMNWEPAGPVAQAYEHSQALFSVITGPIGSGKTTASARRCIRAALWQDPSPYDGVRYARVLAIAPEGRQLRDQVVPSFFQAVEGLRFDSTHLGAGDRDVEFNFYDAQGPVCLKVLFRAVHGLSVEDFFVGREVTGVWLPDLSWWEDDQVALRSIRYSGRYPAPRHRGLGKEAFSGVWGDCADDRRPAWLDDLQHQEFRQPKGFDPTAADGFAADAENVDALRAVAPDFYRRLNGVARR